MVSALLSEQESNNAECILDKIMNLIRNSNQLTNVTAAACAPLLIISITVLDVPKQPTPIKIKPQMALVFGSINVDEFFSVPHIVRPGETLASTGIQRKAGGKGANVSVALGKAGANVSLAGQIGDDGEWIRSLLDSFGVDTQSLITNKTLPTGRATIQISSEGENSIVLYGGTNKLPYQENLHLQRYSYLVVQEEIVHEQTVAAIEQAHANGVKTVYNPSPMPTSQQIESFPWRSLSYLILNAGEANDMISALSGNTQQRSPDNILNAFMQHPSTSSLQGLIITLGEKGLVARINIGDENADFHLPSTPVDAKDTTGAGDTFAGYFVASMLKLDKLTRSSAELALRNAMAVSLLLVRLPTLTLHRQPRWQSPGQALWRRYPY